MKRTILALIILCSVHNIGLAQLSQNRSTSTKIADLLATQPADNPERLADAMQQLELFDSGDLSTLLQQLKPQGSPENIAIEYAVNSYSYYVRNPDREQHRQTFNNGVMDAIGKVKDSDNIRFLIGLLRPTANDGSIPFLSGFLNDPDFSQSAADVLGEIASEAAGQALLTALQNSTNDQISIALINTLGRMAYAPAEQAIISNANTSNTDLQKTVYAALARIAGPKSESLLSKAAKKVNYAYEQSGVTASLLEYTAGIKKKGASNKALKIANKVFKSKNSPPSTKAAALRMLVELEGGKQVNNLLKTAKNADPALRQTALDLLSPYNTVETSNQLTKNLFKASESVQISVLQFLGNENVHTALPIVQEALYKGSDQVNAAAAMALNQLMGNGATNHLLPLLSRETPATTQTIRQIFLSSTDPQLENQLYNQLSGETNETALIHLLHILGERHFGKDGSLVLDLVKKTDSKAVKHAAYQALPQLIHPDMLADLLVLLTSVGNQQQEGVDTANLPHLQQAIINAVQQSRNSQQAVSRISTQYHQAENSTKAVFFPVFSGIAANELLDLVSQAAVEHPDQSLQSAAVVGLAQWSNADAIPVLIQLYRQENRFQNDADKDSQKIIAQGLIRQINQSQLPADQKVLLLKDLFGRTSNADLRRQIIRALEATKTFNAMVFAGRFLDDSELKSASANTVMGIALDNPHFNGQMVVDLLEKTSAVLSGSESSYLREAIRKHIDAMPKGAGFVSLFNGENLEGWKGLVANPIRRAAMDPETLATEQVKADEIMRGGWYVEDGELHFNGKGDNIATVKPYGNFEMLVDWKLAADGEEGDAGIYLRGTPQVQIWDTSRVNVGAQVGSGGLYNNQKHPSKPLLVADNALGEWNTFRLQMIDDKVTVYLNGHLVTDNVVLENYWDRNQPIFPIEQIELQAHGTHVSYRDIYIKELPGTAYFELSEEEKADGFTVLFDGSNMDHWTGNTTDYIISPENTLAVYPKDGSGGNLYTHEEFDDFVFRFSFRLTPGANNGIGIRTPMEGDAAYVGMEIQVLDNGADIYKDLKDWQYHGSVYGIIPAKRGSLKPVGEWNEEEIYVKGDYIRVTLNGTVILEGDLTEATKNGTLDGQDHPGLKNTKGHIGFLGHGSEVHFKDIRIKRL